MSPNHLGLQTYPCRATVYFRSFFFPSIFGLTLSMDSPVFAPAPCGPGSRHPARLSENLPQEAEEKGSLGPQRVDPWQVAQAPPSYFSCNTSNMFQYFPLMRPRISTPNLSVFPSFSVNIPMFFFNGCFLHHQDFYRSLWPISCG